MYFLKSNKRSVRKEYECEINIFILERERYLRRRHENVKIIIGKEAPLRRISLRRIGGRRQKS